MPNVIYSNEWKIKPYLVANKVKFLNLKYEYVIENNEVKYRSKIFNVQKLVSGNISDNDKYSDNVGKYSVVKW